MNMDEKKTLSWGAPALTKIVVNVLNTFLHPNFYTNGNDVLWSELIVLLVTTFQ